MADESKDNVGLACSDGDLESIRASVAAGSFSSDKVAFLKTVCQNYCFTCKQAVILLNEFSFSSDKADALDVFSTSLSDVDSNADDLAEAFDSDDDKKAALEKAAGFTKAEAREIARYAIEDDGHRSSEDIERFVAALEALSFSDDRVACAEKECAEHPSPPFDSKQLITILKVFSFTDDAVRVLGAFTGPQIVYPMTCEEIVEVLNVFSMSDDKKKVLPSLKPFIADPQNKLTIVSSFTFSSDKTEVEEILRDVVVKFRPKTPPAAAIQAALRRVGTCPSGYAWRKVYGGWRCAAGGHYVSDATLAAAMS